MEIVAKRVFNDLGKDVLERLGESEGAAITEYEDLTGADSDTWKYLVFSYEILASL